MSKATKFSSQPDKIILTDTFHGISKWHTSVLIKALHSDDPK